ncbi:MAG: hypothetical protein HQL56_09875 [Magnetococcales bacterium]|nr:hypothetical protein [Magnetococcales bacterium]
MNEIVEHRKTARVLTIVDNQIQTGTPSITLETYNRLTSSGFSDDEARKLIGTALGAEMVMMLRHMEPFDLNRYTATLRQLPRVRAS